MKNTRRPVKFFQKSLLIGLLAASITPKALARLNTTEVLQKTAENQIRNLLEPLLTKYCHDECKLMSIGVTLDRASAETFSPGFDEIEPLNQDTLAPSSGRVKILMDDKVGPVSRSKLLDLLQQYLDTLDYTVKIETIITHFPAPQGSEGKIAELKSRVSKDFLSTVDDLLKHFCPQQCLLADYNLQSEAVNAEEAQYGAPGEFYQDGDSAIRVKDVSATLLMDETLLPEEQNNIVEMVRLKTNNFKHVSITAKSMKFPRPLIEPATYARAGRPDRTVASVPGDTSEIQKEVNNSNESKNNTTSNNTNSNSDKTDKHEKSERIERIERVENGDAVQAELQKFKIFGLIFAFSALALLIFIALSSQKSQPGQSSTVHRIIDTLAHDSVSSTPASVSPSNLTSPQSETKSIISRRYEIERLYDELMGIYAQQPKVAKQVFSRVLTEEGVETTARYIHLFGEGIVIEMLRDPSLQTDMTELMDYYVRNQIELNDDEKLDLLRKLHSRTVVGKLSILGNNASNIFDFLAEMDSQQILEMIRTESMTVKSIVLTQCDPHKRSLIYSQMEPDIRTRVLSELSRIDYLPKDYIFNVAAALKRKRIENPRLNTEALPGSEVLVSLLERTGIQMQKTVLKNLEMTNPESARIVKSKLISLNTLQYLRDGQLLEVVLSLKYDEMIQFLHGAPDEIRKLVFSKAPKELVDELETQVGQSSVLSRENYQAIERKVLNRMKVLASDGQINLLETNERMFSEGTIPTPFVEGVSPSGAKQTTQMRRAG